MALIHCPECGKEISDKSQACIHCGYPLQTQSQIPTSKKILLHSLSEFQKEHPFGIASIIRRATGFSIDEARSLIDRLIEQSSPVVLQDGLTENRANELVQELTQNDINVTICDSSAPIAYASPSKDLDMIACPECGSIEYHAGNRGFSIVTGFIGSGKTVLTCMKCGHRWKPNRWAPNR